VLNAKKCHGAIAPSTSGGWGTSPGGRKAGMDDGGKCRKDFEGIPRFPLSLKRLLCQLAGAKFFVIKIGHDHHTSLLAKEEENPLFSHT
jgi:hypothetical protein